MNVLMIGIGPQVITDDRGDTRARHIEYAKQAGKLTMIVSSFRHEKLTPTVISEHLDVYPTNSGNKPMFVWDAYRIGMKQCEKTKFDLIVSQDPFATGLVAVLLKRRFGVPVLMGNHSLFIDNPYWIKEKPLQYFLFNRLAKWLIFIADGLRVVNPYEKEKYEALGILSSRIWFQPTPVPIEQFLKKPSEESLLVLRRQLGLENKRVLMWVGDPTQLVKDLTTLFKAFEIVCRNIPDVVLLLVGDFSKANHYQKEVGQMNVAEKVKFAGRISHESLPGFYYLSDIYVHSSRYEGLAKVMVEASACGKPIISTQFPGVEAIVQDGETGLLTKIGDSNEFAAKVIELLQNVQMRERIGAQAREYVMARFGRNNMINSVVNIWKDVIDQSSSGRQSKNVIAASSR